MVQFPWEINRHTISPEEMTSMASGQLEHMPKNTIKWHTCKPVMVVVHKRPDHKTIPTTAEYTMIGLYLENANKLFMRMSKRRK